MSRYTALTINFLKHNFRYLQTYYFWYTAFVMNRYNPSMTQPTGLSQVGIVVFGQPATTPNMGISRIFSN